MIDEGKPWQWQPMTEAQAKDAVARLKPHLPRGWKGRVTHSCRSDGVEVWGIHAQSNNEGFASARADTNVDGLIRRLHEAAGEQVYQATLF